MSNVTIKEETCKGCGLCVSVCPKKILKLDKDKLNHKGYHPSVVIDPKECIACGMCARICPDSAIRVIKLKGADKHEQKSPDERK